MFFTTTGFHGFHVFCGVICIAFVTGKAFLGKYTQAHHQGIETIGLYWHFVDLVWIVLFTIIVSDLEAKAKGEGRIPLAVILSEAKDLRSLAQRRSSRDSSSLRPQMTGA